MGLMESAELYCNSLALSFHFSLPVFHIVVYRISGQNFDQRTTNNTVNKQICETIALSYVTSVLQRPQIPLLQKGIA